MYLVNLFLLTWEISSLDFNQWAQSWTCHTTVIRWRWVMQVFHLWTPVTYHHHICCCTLAYFKTSISNKCLKLKAKKLPKWFYYLLKFQVTSSCTIIGSRKQLYDSKHELCLAVPHFPLFLFISSYISKSWRLFAKLYCFMFSRS